MDIFSKKKRSEIMSHIKSKDTKLEVLFRKMLRVKGLHFGKNLSKYFGKPDIIFKKHKLVIFIDSCFWHGCKRHLRMPAAKRGYWKNKIERNKKRDKEVNRYYKKGSWEVLRIWEHEINKNPDGAVNEIVKFLK